VYNYLTHTDDADFFDQNASWLDGEASNYLQREKERKEKEEEERFEKEQKA